MLSSFRVQISRMRPVQLAKLLYHYQRLSVQGHGSVGQPAQSGLGDGAGPSPQQGNTG